MSGERRRAATLLATLLRVGVDPTDDPELRVRKILVLSVAAMIAPLAVLWGFLYLALGAPLAAAVPWSYVAVSVIGIGLFAVHRNLTAFSVSQLVPYLLLPFILMWVLGGFIDGSVVALWAAIAPLAALILSGPRAALPWLYAFLTLLVITAIVDPSPTDPVPAAAVMPMFVLNLGAVAAVTFGAVAAYAGGRLSLLDETRRLVHRYLSPAVAASLLAEPARAELGGEMVEVTVLFADLRSFTSYSERTPPHDVVALLNRYFGVAIPAIQEHGGTTLALAGDEVMAVFNAPERQPDHARRAVAAARAIHAGIAAIAGAEEPRFGIGINTGPAVVGNIGGEDFRNFTAIGDTTNTAARLQTHAAAGEIVVGAMTAACLGAEVPLARRGMVTLKGKAEPVATFVLGSEQPGSRGPR
jgi:class 3 adenylate cyclase